MTPEQEASDIETARQAKEAFGQIVTVVMDGATALAAITLIGYAIRQAGREDDATNLAKRFAEGVITGFAKQPNVQAAMRFGLMSEAERETFAAEDAKRRASGGGR